MLIESMQAFAEGGNDSGDSPSELVKDIFMHLIQEEKHKVFSSDDWFQIINAMHQFLTQTGPKADVDQFKQMQSQYAF